MGFVGRCCLIYLESITDIVSKEITMLKLLDKNGKDNTDESQYCTVPGSLDELWCSAWSICKESLKKRTRARKAI